jgi:hypothetical protein
MLLLLGIPVFVWMKWRSRDVDPGPDANEPLARSYSSPARTLVPRDDVERVHVGLGMD